MEKSYPFPTGYGFGKKSPKFMTLSHELGINIDIKYCKDLNLFIMSYCAISLIFKFIGTLLDDFSIVHGLSELFGVFVWMFGIRASIWAMEGYLSLKPDKIKSNSYWLLGYLIVQSIYFGIKLILFSLRTGLSLLIILCYSIELFASYYTFALNYNLSTKIIQYKTLS